MLVMLGWIAWVLTAVAAFLLGLPTSMTARGGEAFCTYYACWGITVGLLFYLQYRILASMHHGRQALIADGIAVCVAGFFYLLRRWSQRGEP